MQRLMCAEAEEHAEAVCMQRLMSMQRLRSTRGKAERVDASAAMGRDARGKAERVDASAVIGRDAREGRQSESMP